MVQVWHHAGQVLRVVADVATRSPISESPLPRHAYAPSTVDCDVDVKTRPLRRTMDCMNTRPSSLHGLNLLLGYHFTIHNFPPRPSQADQIVIILREGNSNWFLEIVKVSYAPSFFLRLRTAMTIEWFDCLRIAFALPRPPPTRWGAGGGPLPEAPPSRLQLIIRTSEEQAEQARTRTVRSLGLLNWPLNWFVLVISYGVSAFELGGELRGGGVGTC